MFQFPTLAFNDYTFTVEYPDIIGMGFPIRRSADHHLFDSSPRLIAAYHVLHRLSTPRHPPCTLHSLNTFTARCGAMHTSSFGAIRIHYCPLTKGQKGLCESKPDFVSVSSAVVINKDTTLPCIFSFQRTMTQSSKLYDHDRMTG